jgi:alpha-1,6-mannosyltransferase
VTVLRAQLHLLGAAMTLTMGVFARYAHLHETYSIAWWLAMFMTMSVAVLWVAFRNDEADDSASCLWLLLGWAIAMRFVSAFTPAFFEDDFYRYLWDGYRTLVDGNPYRAAPKEFFGIPNPPGMEDILSRVNYPHVPTIYGPALQHLFAFSAWGQVGALLPWKLIACSADIALIIGLAKAFGPMRAMLYAWSPLVVHEIAVAAHPDGLIGALIFFAWLAARRQSALWLAVFLGTAIAMKVHAVIALPFLLLAMRSRASQLGVVTATALVYALHWLPYWEGFNNAWQSFFTFARDWQFNALGFAAINSLMPSVARAIAMVIIMALLAACLCWQRKNQQERMIPAIVCAFAALLFFSPVINPWYLLWLLPLACGMRWITPWVAAVMVMLSYASDFNLGYVSSADGRLPQWVTMVECAAIVAALVWDLKQRFTKTTRATN